MKKKEQDKQLLPEGLDVALDGRALGTEGDTVGSLVGGAAPITAKIVITAWTIHTYIHTYSKTIVA